MTDVHIGCAGRQFKGFYIDFLSPRPNIEEKIVAVCKRGATLAGAGDMLSSEHLRSEIEAVVRERIRSGEVVRVLVDRAESFDGDPVINVKVIYNSDTKKLDIGETVGLTNLVRNRLHKAGEDAFPIFSYILKSEAGKLAAAG